ncbi:MAG: glutaredoxin [Saprospiraceae bacterium]|nr:glutaredoxin [Saprospiraceae bacterium]
MKITLDPSGNANYGISYKYYKKSTKPATNITPMSSTAAASMPESRATRPDLGKGIVIFSKDGCGKCAYAIKYMKEKNLTFKEINISANEADKKLMWDTLLSGGFSGTSVQTPVIMVDGKVHYNMDIKSFLADLKP